MLNETKATNNVNNTFCVNPALEERVTKNPDSLAALSIQFRVDPFLLTLLKVKEVTSPLTVVLVAQLLQI